MQSTRFCVDQITKLDIPTDGRFKLNPKIPLGYIGSVVFSSTPVAISSEIHSEPLDYIHEVLE